LTDDYNFKMRHDREILFEFLLTIARANWGL